MRKQDLEDITLELDHVFVFCTPGDGLEERMKAHGFVETYRRRHPGQGTQNVCFCFDNAFVERVTTPRPGDSARTPHIMRAQCVMINSG